jgi:hypothetical protein
MKAKESPKKNFMQLWKESLELKRVSKNQEEMLY